MSECKCSMSISVLGDGCRYCQPQKYIDHLEGIDKENDELLDKIDKLEHQLSKREDDYRKLRERSDEQIEDLERQLAEAREVIGNILNITYDSEGVAGYHDNGDVALWEEFEEIQQLEEQLKEKGENE